MADLDRFQKILKEFETRDVEFDESVLDPADLEKYLFADVWLDNRDLELLENSAVAKGGYVRGFKPE